MRVLLLGASSYLGARLYFDLLPDFEVVGTFATHKIGPVLVQLDVTDNTAISKIITSYKPEVIIHAANNANSRWCEANPVEAEKLNQTATQYIVEGANHIGARVIYISSFVVSQPSNIYSQTKAKSEKITKNTKNGYLIIRPSLILGFSPNTQNDRPFNRLLKNLDEHSPAIYDATWKFQPTYIGHVSEVIHECIKRNIWNQTISVATDVLKSRFETARDILSPFGISVSVANTADTTMSTIDNLEALKRLRLPMYSYEQMIDKIIGEIKNRQMFTFEGR